MEHWKHAYYGKETILNNIAALQICKPWGAKGERKKKMHLE